MSKSAIKYINSCVSGKTADLLIGCINNDRIRKNWRNADVLARFLVDTVANAYQCENSTTFEDNGHTDMDDAISSYVEANLCDWDQAKFLASSFGKQTAQEISANLDEWRTKNAEFEQSQKSAQSPAADVQRTFWAANDYTARRDIVEADHDEANAINAEIDNIISYAQGRRPIQQDGDVNWVFETAVRVWKETRNAACRYKDAFDAFHRETYCDTFTDVCRAWLGAMDEANKMNDGIDLACRILTAMEGEKGRAQAAQGCLIRDGHNEVVYLTAIAFRITKFKRIMRETAHQVANSFGGVIGEHEELIERLENDDFIHQAADIEAAFDEISGMDEWKAQRRAYVAMLNNRK